MNKIYISLVVSLTLSGNLAMAQPTFNGAPNTIVADAEAVALSMEASVASDVNISLLKRWSTKGDERDTKKLLSEAKKRYKKAEKMGDVPMKIAAAKIIMDIDREDVVRFVLKAMKDDSKVYRNEILMLASEYADANMYIELLKAADKKQTPANVDILNWIGSESQDPKKHEVLKNLELRFDKTAYQAFMEQIQTGDFAVQQAAVWVLVKLEHKSFIPYLASMLVSSDEQIILLAYEALMSFHGNINDAVASVIPQATDKGKICGLELLGSRKADARMNTVLKQTNAANPKVKAVAYKVLKSVVSEQDFIQLCGMIETCEAPYIPSMQEAIIVSLKNKSAEEQLSTVVSRMYQAEESKKHVYYKVLAATGNPKAIDIIYEGFNKDQGEAKDAALKAYVESLSSPTLTEENRLLSLRKVMDIAQTDEQKNLILKQVGNIGSYLSLLYAYDFIENVGTKQAAATAVMNIALAHKEYTGDNVREMLTKVSASLDYTDSHKDREAIMKHLAEMPNEKGFVSLSNSKDLDNLCSVKQYVNFELYMDWSLAPSNKEMDAGVYLRGIPLVQILDSSRVKAAENKLGEWNTFFIKMVNDRVTVSLNGKLVADNVQMTNSLDRKQTNSPVKQIELQTQGSKVFYRNIYIKELKTL